jgi:hypothetical protein
MSQEEGVAFCERLFARYLVEERAKVEIEVTAVLPD